jgi:hypothetical protein
MSHYASPKKLRSGTIRNVKQKSPKVKAAMKKVNQVKKFLASAAVTPGPTSTLDRAAANLLASFRAVNTSEPGGSMATPPRPTTPTDAQLAALIARQQLFDQLTPARVHTPPIPGLREAQLELYQKKMGLHWRQMRQARRQVTERKNEIASEQNFIANQLDFANYLLNKQKINTRSRQLAAIGRHNAKRQLVINALNASGYYNNRNTFSGQGLYKRALKRSRKRNYLRSTRSMFYTGKKPKRSKKRTLKCLLSSIVRRKLKYRKL